MPFHTIVPFSLHDFLAASLDYLLANPIVYVALVFAACVVVYKCLAIAARRRVEKRAQNRVVSIAVARASLAEKLGNLRGKGAA